jgi:uncharacterized protein YbaP (TraB family)
MFQKYSHYLFIIISVIIGYLVTPNCLGATLAALQIEAPNGKQSILLGSVHVWSPELIQPTASIFDKAHRYVIEHKNGIPDKTEESITTGSRSPWAIALSEKELNVYFSRAKCARVSQSYAEELLTYRDAQLANIIAYTVCDDTMSGKSRDEIMNAYAELRNLPIDSLEDTKWIENQRHKIPDKTEITGLQWILRREPREILSEIAHALNTGDYEFIAKLTDTSTGADNTEIQQRDEIMVHQRNEAWLPHLRRYLDEGDAVILVGAAHLPGPNGLISMLRKAGYKVSSIQLQGTP